MINIPPKMNFVPVRCNLSGVNSATASGIFFLRALTFAGKDGKYTLYLTNTHTKTSSRVKTRDRGGYNIGHY
jgi:hypothetical protein